MWRKFSGKWRSKDGRENELKGSILTLYAIKSMNAKKLISSPFILHFRVKVGELTISSSVWQMSHPTSRHLHCGTTPCVVSTTVQSRTEPQSACGVPQNTCITNHTCGASTHLRCTSNMPAYRYVIVQFPMHESAHLCELEVYVRCKFNLLNRKLLGKYSGKQASKQFLYCITDIRRNNTRWHNSYASNEQIEMWTKRLESEYMSENSILDIKFLFIAALTSVGNVRLCALSRRL